MPLLPWEMFDTSIRRDFGLCFLSEDEEACARILPYFLGPLAAVLLCGLAMSLLTARSTLQGACPLVSQRSAPVIVLITGANRGIGFQIARRLCACIGPEGTVIVTARRELDCNRAVASLRSEFPGANVVGHTLDVTDPLSVKALREWLEAAHPLNTLVRRVCFNLPGTGVW